MKERNKEIREKRKNGMKERRKTLKLCIAQ
jgi:hypothetical protein